jgi:uncharacterized protein YacL
MKNFNSTEKNDKIVEKYNKIAEEYNKIANVSMAFMFIGVFGVMASIFSSLIIHGIVTAYFELFCNSLILVAASLVTCIIGQIGFNYFMEKGFNK